MSWRPSGVDTRHTRRMYVGSMVDSREKGKRWEREVAGWLRANGYPYAERCMVGTVDRGDLNGCPNLVIDAKDRAQLSLGAWCDQLNREVDAAPPGTLGFLVVKRKRVTSPRQAFAVMELGHFVDLLHEAGR